jgi:hypothetical protein
MVCIKPIDDRRSLHLCLHLCRTSRWASAVSATRVETIIEVHGGHRERAFRPRFAILGACRKEIVDRLIRSADASNVGPPHHRSTNETPAITLCISPLRFLFARVHLYWGFSWPLRAPKRRPPSTAAGWTVATTRHHVRASPRSYVTASATTTSGRNGRRHGGPPATFERKLASTVIRSC